MDARPEHRFHDEGDTVTCGECGRSWCGLCHPAPSARCWYEYDHEETEPQVTDSDRLARALTVVTRWLENYETNEARHVAEGRDAQARDCAAHAQDCRDIIAVLDGSEDDYILQLRTFNPPW